MYSNIPSGLKAVTADCTIITLGLCLKSTLAALSSTSNSSSVLPNFLRLQVAFTTSVAVITVMVSFGHNTDKYSAQDTPETPPPMITNVQLIAEDIFTASWSASCMSLDRASQS